MFERNRANQISSFLKKIFLKFLSGFRKGYSCQNTLLRMIQDWITAFDNFVGSIAVDLSKAFNSLPHGLLVAKLHAYDVELSACKVLCSYLHDRHHRVKMCDAKYEWLNIEKGVLQGSILGPFLCSIFINDTVCIGNAVSIYDYADDNCISHAYSSIDQIKNVFGTRYS